MSADFSFNPFDDATRRNPYPFYAQGRELRAFRHPGLPVTSIFNYDDVTEVLRDWRTWSSQFPPPPGFPEMTERVPSMIGLDPPAHDRLRGLVNQAFTPEDHPPARAAHGRDRAAAARQGADAAEGRPGSGADLSAAGHRSSPRSSACRPRTASASSTGRTNSSRRWVWGSSRRPTARRSSATRSSSKSSAPTSRSSPTSAGARRARTSSRAWSRPRSRARSSASTSSCRC